MQNPTLKKTNLKPPRYWEYVLAFFFIIIPSACIDKREILKEGSRVTIPCDDISIKVKAVVAFFPVTDLERWAQTSQTPEIKNAYIPQVCAKGLGLKAKSPIHAACGIHAPTLLIHGDQDTRVPMDQSLEMAKAMLDCGKKVQLQLVKGGGHTLKKNHKGWIEAWEHTKKFLAEHLKQIPIEKPEKAGSGDIDHR